MTETFHEKPVVKEGIVLDENDQPIGPAPETFQSGSSGSRRGRAFVFRGGLPSNSFFARTVLVLGGLAFLTFGVLLAGIVFGVGLIVFFFRWLLKR